MQAIGIVGFSNSGKTTLVSRLSECMEARGLRVAIAKHTHHELDKPDTDTALLMKEGRTIIGLSNPRTGGGEAMIHWGSPRYLADLVPLLDADILLVEGGKTLGWLPRVLCLRSTPELLATLPDIHVLRPELAIATYGENEVSGLPCYTAEKLDDLADCILQKAFSLPALDCGACGEKNCEGMTRRIVAGEAFPADCKARGGDLEITVNGHPVGLNPFVSRIIAGSIQGMLDSLKGAGRGEVVIRMHHQGQAS